MLSSSVMLPSDKQFLEQKLDLLQEQLQQYRQKQQKRSKLNESILQTYKQNQTFRQSREQRLQKQLRQLSTKHREQLRKAKSQFSRQKSLLQTQNLQQKQKLQMMEYKVQQIKIEYERINSQMKLTIQSKHLRHIAQVEKDCQVEAQSMSCRIQELVEMNLMYKEYIERKYAIDNQNRSRALHRGKYQLGRDKENDILRQVDRVRDYDNQSKPIHHNYPKNTVATDDHLKELTHDNTMAKKVLKSSKIVISQLSSRINRAMYEINQTKKYQPY